MLELAQFPVEQAEFGDGTRYRDGRLTINQADLRQMLEADSRFARVDVELACPGAAVRITHILDVVQPRVKADGQADYFFGSLGDLRLAGCNRTHVLTGCAVVATGQVAKSEPTLIDMAGTGAEVTKFGRTCNVVLIPQRAPDVPEDDFVRAILKAKLRAAVYLARATLGQESRLVESFDLPPLVRRHPGTDLPRVAHIYYLQSRGFGRERLLYGISTRGMMPTLVHPNEILDGAVVFNGHTSPGRHTTYDHTNNAVIRAIYARHGTDLWFSGVVLCNHHSSLEDKQHTALLAARLAAQVLGADTAVISKDGGGQGDVDVMLCCTRCGELGLPTVLMVPEEPGAGGTFPFISTSPYADAVVSTGAMTEAFTLTGPVHRLLGGGGLCDGQDSANDVIRVPLTKIVGAVDMQGSCCLSSALF